MEEGIGFLDVVKSEFDCPCVNVRTYSPLTLAYIGDAVFDLVIRSVLVARGNSSVDNLHKRSAALVRATAQSQMVRFLEQDLTKEELDIYKRGRNAKSHSSSKNAGLADYKRATGFEALVGWLYLTNQTGRAAQLIHLGVGHLEHK